MIFKSLRLRILFSLTGFVFIALLFTTFFFQQSVKEELYEALEENSLEILEAVHHAIELQYNSIQFYESAVLSYSKKELKNCMDVAFTMIRSSYKDSLSGRLSEEEAQLRIIHELTEIRYNDGSGYFWINNTDKPYPRMIVHPTIPELDGTVLDDPDFDRTIGEGKNLFSAAVDIGLSRGQGYYSYLWPKPVDGGLSEEQPKISYVRYFEPWNWIVGTGAYIDDIERAVQDRLDTVIDELNITVHHLSIGENGYFFIFRENNIVSVHPSLAGEDGNGWINPETGGKLLEELKSAAFKPDNSWEYTWDKPGAEKEYRFRKKAYVTYFEPLSLYIVSTYYMEDYDENMKALAGETNIFSILFLVIAAVVSLTVARSITSPLNLLIETISRTDENGIPLNTVPGTGAREINQLSETMNRMLGAISMGREELQNRAEKLSEAYGELSQHKDHLEELVRDRTVKLEESIDHLTRTQDKLVESEKMASLGGLVAGIAHEINTPVGIGITAASLLDEKTGFFEGGFRSGNLSRGDFEEYIKIAKESSNLILVNMQRAAHLIQSFKQVAVDQASEDLREFNINEYMGEILASLHPAFKKTEIEITVDAPEDVVVNSYPGALSQIMTNLLMNSLKHGFGDDKRGSISIVISRTGNLAEILYEDSGQGIPEENLARIFDPFFTTKRGEGGSGLGMYIVYNLVVRTLGGSITCRSRPGDGVLFKFNFPIDRADPGVGGYGKQRSE